MKTIQEYLRENGYNTVSDETYVHIQEWLDWYQGYVKSFHHYSVYNGIQYVQRDRYGLGMSKIIAEDWANLLLNEKTIITTDNAKFDKIMEQILRNNNFDVRANQLIEIAFALGAGAFVEYLDNDNVMIDYIRADMIYPLSWDNGDITECAFGSYKTVHGKEMIYLQIHTLENGTYNIENHYVCAESGEEKPLPENMLPVVNTGMTTPLFQIVTPNIVNNIDLDSPIGISIYANAIDQLEGTDIVFDSYINEFELGKRKIMVPITLAKMTLGTDGVTRPVFDNNDTTFYAIPSDRSSDNKIETYAPELRAEAHDIGMKKALDLLSFKCGLGTGRYRFDSGVVKTATEIISEKSELFQSLKKHEIMIEGALINMVKAIYALYTMAEPTIEVTIHFDDSIIEDKEVERERDRKDVAMGVMSLVEYRMRWYGEDEATAKSKIPEQADLLPDTV